MKTFMLSAALLASQAFAECPNACSGHGTCDSYDRCTCYKEVDFSHSMWTGGDCSQFTCPRGVSWNEPVQGSLHATDVECSDAGVCNRLTGECECFPGYEGSACQRTNCPNDCSNHGTCRSNVDFAIDFSEAVHAQQVIYSGGSTTDSDSYYDYFLVTYDNAWDSDMQYGCLCDVGFRGSDCSLMECPTSVDPLDDETLLDYETWYADGTTGGDGNVVGVSEWHARTKYNNYNPISEYPSQGAPAGDECSSRGTCDYFTGVCSCSTGFHGTACEKISALA